MKRFFATSVLAISLLAGGAVLAAPAEAAVCGATATHIGNMKINGAPFAMCIPNSGVRRLFLQPLSQ